MSNQSTPSFSIGISDSNCVTIELQSSPADKSTEGFNWISARALVKAGTFSGKSEIMITKDDLTLFIKELKRMYDGLAGTVVFRPIEEQLVIEISISGTGQVTLTGTLFEYALYGNKLIFEFHLDQTYLPKVISDIQSGLSRLEKNKV